LTVGQGSALMMSGNTYLVHQGDIQNNGLINSDSLATLTLNGSHNLQEIRGNSYDSTRIGNILQNDSGIQINTHVRIIARDSFVNGFVRLNNSNWRLEQYAHYAGTDTSGKFFQTNGLGYLYKDHIGSTNFVFPIGTLPQTGSYTPFTLKNDSIVDNFGIRVADGQYASYDSNGAGIGSPLTLDRLQKTWVLNEDVPGGSKVSIAMQWSALQEGSGFTRDSSVLDIYNTSTSSFSFEYNTTVSGSNPYVLSVANINNVSFAKTPLSLMNLSVALPVELYTFNVVRVNNDGYLTWETLSEKDNDYFGVERSVNGYTFTNIGKVKGQGHSVSALDYSYTDKDIMALDVNTVYYRLRQVNYDGTYTYSLIHALRMDNNHSDAVSVYPNPTAGTLHLNITTAENKKIEISVSDAIGHVLYSHTSDIVSGSNEMLMNISPYPSGLYLVKVTSAAEQYVYRIIKMY